MQTPEQHQPETSPDVPEKKILLKGSYTGIVDMSCADFVKVTYKIGDESIRHVYVKEQFVGGRTPEEGQRVTISIEMIAEGNELPGTELNAVSPIVAPEGAESLAESARSKCTRVCSDESTAKIGLSKEPANDLLDAEEFIPENQREAYRARMDDLKNWGKEE